LPFAYCPLPVTSTFNRPINAMPWITPTENDLIARLSGPELAAYRTAALKAGQSDPVVPVLAGVVSEVRGYVAGHKANALGPAGTIPDTLLDAAMALVVARLPARLPLTLTDARIDAKKDALALLSKVAAGQFFIAAPEDGEASAEQPASQIEQASGDGPYPTSSQLSGLF
jgi:phage gp36-like protein